MEMFLELFDSTIITEILNRAFLTVALSFGFTKDSVPRFPAFIDSDVIEKQLNNGLKMYGYKINNQIVGCIGYSFYKDQVYFIERLATLPEFRHLGIGKKLMEYIENKIKENGGNTAEINVVDKNVILEKKKKKMNYKQIRIDKLVDGKIKLPFDSCVMTKELI
jgi:ribosomal protein S18 acetylase RimI-like enzyme